MKTIKLLSLVTIALVFVIGSACKYEEGPALSLRTKKARLVGEWKVDKMFDKNGEEVEPSELDMAASQEFTKDNDYILRVEGDTFIEGEWEFSDDKESVILKFEFFGQSQSQKIRILRLKNNELWLEDEDGDVTHFIPA
jgi:hypothetical protein